VSRPLVLSGGRVLDLAARAAPLRDLLVIDGKIAAISPSGEGRPADAEIVDVTDRLLMPGLVNAHTHAHGALAKGLCGDRWPLELLLNANPAFNRGRTTEDKYLCGLLQAVELVRRGCTATFDMFAEFPTPSVEGVHAVAKAYADVGVRAVLAPMIADRTLYLAVPGLIDALPEGLRGEVAALRAAPSEASLSVCERIYETWPFDRMIIRPGIAPTIPLHCSDDFLRRCAAFSARYDLPLQTHLAESRTQAISGPKRYGLSLTRHLAKLGVLSPRTSAAHAIWLDRDDIALLADHGASVVHNPLSNARIGSGVADIRGYRDAGINVGIGTDATNTSDSLNMFEATRWASYLSRLRNVEPASWVTADEVIAMATEGSAKAIGFDDVTGRLEAGYAADIVFLDLTHITYTPLNDIVRQIVFSESGAALTGVMIAGHRVLWDGKLLTIDEAGLRRRANEASARLIESNRGARELAEKLEGFIGSFCVAQSRRVATCGVCGSTH
jgi:guanine deaminase